MKKYYFTFGYSGHPYKGGWMEIHAVDLVEAQYKFCNRFGKAALNEHGHLRYACSYSREQLEETRMDVQGNYGAFCHEVIR